MVSLLTKVTTCLILCPCGQNQNREALTLLNEAIEFNPFYSKYHYARGAINSSLGNFDACIRDYTSAIEISPGLHDAYFGRALCKEDLGDFDGAIDDYAFSSSIKPGVDIFNNTGAIYDSKIGRLTNTNPDPNSNEVSAQLKFYAHRSLNVWLKALALDPRNAGYLWRAGRSAMMLNDYNQGCILLQQAKALGHSSAAEFYVDYRNARICK